MTVTSVLRTAALGLAVIGAIDPALPVERSVPRPIEVRTGGRDATGPIATAIVERLSARLQNKAAFSSSEAPVARVIVGDPQPTAFDVPTSFVALDTPPPNVKLASVGDPRPGIVGWRTSISAMLEASGVAGATSVIVLEQNGVELARTEHRWRRPEEHATVSLQYVAPVEGAARLTVRVQPLEGERSADDNSADVRALSRARRLKVLVHESRPSWAAAFVRRVLENNAAFEVSSFSGASKGLAVTAGRAAERLGARIDAFDAVIIGAPEGLQAADVDALARFARRRGGSVVLLPDRRPSGPYVALVQDRSFEEVLVETPVIARGAEGGAIRASELLLPRADEGQADIIAEIAHAGQTRLLVLELPLGAGRVMFSGALDAWRYRAEGDDDFRRFWTSVIAGAALAAPDRLDIAASPGIIRPGEEIAIRLRVRSSELDDSGGTVRVPPVSVRLISSTGAQEIVRMWPTADPGTFEGRIEAPSSGTYDIEARAGNSSADTVVIVANDARRPAQPRDARAAIAAATGGVVVGTDDLDPLVQAVLALPAPSIRREVHPSRSPWFVAAFAMLLCVEWALRRRVGWR